ncbi:LysR family transcriptional regulator [Pseudohalocynthiibacter aestuariivivens]|jgi:LysR family transcriptional regulator, glycine cleavage system transcriptional activator|uniref:LysR family transcriptional regulator n=1 Tax=Pseudohalocynthiibacter aestuariivivens TaxID=1591409 RepID=A0ABV5JDX6_9RHOB|nr:MULTISPECIES: LysR family transcriptional regulator [Pseudohalocynthiibacter]MBS9718079.1 LysR family transcriptional regulator [Pseudohalocynthiibacter aestuariivivens]MCK0104647.1 LysR family transcriptional regulator [Pseudohalocynthiibacter sp. F2068]
MFPPIQNLRAFVAVANTGQFRIAAEQIGVSESAVSHQIARLEAQMGVQLLERGRNGAMLTEVGRVFYLPVSAGLREIERGLQLVNQDKSNIVTISAPQTLSSLWLAPNLASFYEGNPSVELRVFATDRICDLKNEGIDFALRRSTGDWRGCNQEPFCDEEIFPVATKALSVQVRELGWQRAFQVIPIILNEAHVDEWERWSAEVRIPLADNMKFRRLSSYDQVQAAVINGLGIGMGRTPLCLEALGDGRLHRIGSQSCATHAYQLVWPSDRRTHSRQRAFLNWLRKMKPDRLAKGIHTD